MRNGVRQLEFGRFPCAPVCLAGQPCRLLSKLQTRKVLPDERCDQPTTRFRSMKMGRSWTARWLAAGCVLWSAAGFHAFLSRSAEPGHGEASRPASGSVSERPVRASTFETDGAG